MEPNFSGYVTKYGVKCADGRVIQHGAFKGQDGAKVPLVYQHNHSDVSQVLGYTILKAKEDGIWGDSYLNKSAKAIDAGFAVQHGDIDKYSVWAKDLIERGYHVDDGEIQETSLVLAGKNPGANIENVLTHGILDPDDTLMIVGGEIVHDDVETPPEPAPPAEPKPDEDNPDDAPPGEPGKSQAEVLDTLTDEQKLAVNGLFDDTLKEAITQALTEEPALQHSNIDSSKKGPNMSRNQFDESKKKNGGPLGGVDTLPQLKHSDVQSVLSAYKGTPGDIKGFNADMAHGSLRQFVRSSQGQELMHADTYGIDNMDVLFPDAQAVETRPTWVDRRQDWVKKFMAGTSKTPFSRVKTMYADITADEARAKGYIKGNQKTDEVFPVFKRVTGPAWIYKRQRLDREDIIEITSFDVVAWMKAEMRGKLDEELARAALFGDGRPALVGGEINPDKIQDPGANNNSGNGIRAIISDNDLYTATYNIQFSSDTPTGADWNAVPDTVTEAQEFYMGSGNKTAFMTYRLASKLLTIRDEFGHRLYRNLSEVAGDMDVSEIVRVPTELFPTDVLCIVLDLADYNFGTNRGGEVTLFDDFDINVNQYIYLIEAYLSGALVLPYAAQVFKSVVSTSVELTPTQPAIEDNVITIPTQTGVVFKNEATGATLAAASTVTLNNTDTKSIKIEATPTAGYHFESNVDQKDAWTYKYKA